MVMGVVLLGYGAIGRAVHRSLAEHHEDVEVLRIVDRAVLESGAQNAATALSEAIAGARLVVECASPAAVRSYGPGIIGSGTDLLVASLGALVDPRLAQRLLHDGPGRCYLSTGAIGGLDLIRATAATIQEITLCTRKAPLALLHPGLPEQLRALLAGMRPEHGPEQVFSGSVADAIHLFPSNINVAAALGLAAGNMDRVRVQIIADPTALSTTHGINVHTSSGHYSFEISNVPDPANPATSALTARSMVSGVLRLAGRGPHFI